MPRTPSKRARTASIAPARVDAWLIGAFLLLLAGAMAVSVRPAAAASTLELIGGKGEAQKAQRDVIRAAFFTVRAAKLNVSGGKDLIPVRASDTHIGGAIFIGEFVASRAAPRIAAHWFEARAPPSA